MRTGTSEVKCARCDDADPTTEVDGVLLCDVCESIDRADKEMAAEEMALQRYHERRLDAWRGK